MPYPARTRLASSMLRSVMKCRDLLLKLSDAGEPIKADMLWLTLRRSRIASENSSLKDLWLTLEKEVTLSIPVTK